MHGQNGHHVLFHVVWGFVRETVLVNPLPNQAVVGARDNIHSLKNVIQVYSVLCMVVGADGANGHSVLPRVVKALPVGTDRAAIQYP